MRHTARINENVLPVLDKLKVGTHKTRDIYAALRRKKFVLGKDFCPRTLVTVLRNLPEWDHNGMPGKGSRWIKSAVKTELAPEPEAALFAQKLEFADSFDAEAFSVLLKLHRDLTSLFARYGIQP